MALHFSNSGKIFAARCINPCTNVISQLPHSPSPSFPLVLIWPCLYHPGQSLLEVKLAREGYEGSGGARSSQGNCHRLGSKARPDTRTSTERGEDPGAMGAPKGSEESWFPPHTHHVAQPPPSTGSLTCNHQGEVETLLHRFPVDLVRQSSKAHVLFFMVLWGRGGWQQVRVCHPFCLSLTQWQGVGLKKPLEQSQGLEERPVPALAAVQGKAYTSSELRD